jgi:hypothetical protein
MKGCQHILAFSPYDVIKYTLEQSKDVDRSTIHYPMCCHLKIRFQILRNERINEVIATNSYFAHEN